MKVSFLVLLLAPALFALPDMEAARRRLAEDDHDGHDHDDDGHDHDGEAGEKEKAPCFPSSAKITLGNGRAARMDALKEGDVIVATDADGKLTTDTVSVLSLAKPAAFAKFVTLSTASSTVSLTEAHHVPFGEACCAMMKPAKDVQVGDKIWHVAEGASSATSEVVTAKSTAAMDGLHSPVLVNGGFPVVDGIVTSFDDFATVTLAHRTLKYLLPLCKATGTCNLFRRTFLNADRQYIDEVTA